MTLHTSRRPKSRRPIAPLATHIPDTLMRRILLLVAIIGVHAMALLCANGDLSPLRTHNLQGQDIPPASSSPADTAPDKAGVSSEPPASEPDSTYEQYRRERERAAANQPGESAETDTAAEPASPSNPFHVQLNGDFTNAYFYRGILQQDHGLIVQPAAKLLINLYKRDDLAIDGFIGTWNSFGSNGGSNTGDLISDWYECDLLAGFVVTKDKLSLTTSYVFLTSPSDAYQTVQELDFTLGLDDSEYLGKFAMHPYALLAFETGTVGSDGGDGGIYLELGVSPGFSFDLGKTPIAVTFPVAVGLSLDDYYDFAGGDDSTFGFVQAGAKLAMPLPFGERFGQWTLNAGASLMYLGDNLANINHDDNLEVIGTIGLQWNF